MSLGKYLAELKQSGRPLVVSKLVILSDLSAEELQLFKEAWAEMDTELRRQIIYQLVELAEDNFELDFDAIFKACLSDKDEKVRLKAIEGLWECEDRLIIDPLVHLLREDTSESVRAAAATGLGKFAMLAELGKLRPSDAAKVEAALFSVIDDRREPIEVRRRSVEAIAPFSQPQVEEIIRQAYKNDNPKMRASAIYAMGRNCNRVWLPNLLNELGNADPEMRFEAAEACGDLGEREAVPYLIKLIDDVDAQVRSAAIEALGRIGGSEAKRALRKCLSHPDELVRAASEEALEDIAFDERPLFSKRDIIGSNR